MDAKTHIKTAIFKTPDVTDSGSRGRDVAKDLFHAGGTPPSVRIWSGHGFPRDHRRIVTGGAVTLRGGAYEKRCHADS